MLQAHYNYFGLSLAFYSETLVPITGSVEGLAAGAAAIAAARTSDVSGEKQGGGRSSEDRPSTGRRRGKPEAAFKKHGKEAQVIFALRPARVELRRL